MRENLKNINGVRIRLTDHTDNWLNHYTLTWPLFSKRGKLALMVAVGIHNSGISKKVFHKKAGVKKSELDAILTCKPTKLDLLIHAEEVLGMKLFNILPPL